MNTIATPVHDNAGPRPGQGKPRVIEVHAQSVLGTPEGITFRMMENGQFVDDLIFNKKKENMRRADWHEISFVLHDPTGSDLRFHPVATQAMWVSRGTDKKKPLCPRKPSQDPEGEFVPIEVSEDGLTLRARNSNGRECLLAFALNFVHQKDTDRDPRIVATLDPGAGNQNSGVDAE